MSKGTREAIKILKELIQGLENDLPKPRPHGFLNKGDIFIPNKDERSMGCTDEFMLCQVDLNMYCLIGISEGYDQGNRWHDPVKLDSLQDVPDNSPLWGSIQRKGWTRKEEDDV